ncbi:hypothetical protein FGIG_07015 [Fasciola gigantica]|uniref:Uncharacterized protein n=1 Tax=Fasciola gigantica TaxID=46835 RepID=A0A504YRR4_FASGI|nr:hypothetical protein FGIG_07015 [Fasciola gigantica]
MGTIHPLGWFLLHHLLGVHVPQESSSDAVIGYDQPFDMAPSSALFWTEWSEWPSCPSSEPCHVDKAHRSSTHMMKRTRLCQRQSLNDLMQTSHVLTSLTWIRAAHNHSPCTVEHARETQVKFCYPVSSCGEDGEPAIAKSNTTESVLLDSDSDENQPNGMTRQHTPPYSTGSPNADSIMIESLDEEALWKPWYLVVACRPLILELDELSDGYAWDHLLRNANKPKQFRCEPGIEIYRRDCQPFSSRDGRCGGIKGNGSSTGAYQLRHAHCWIDEGCLGTNQTILGPMACNFRSFLSEKRLLAAWYRTPYGEIPRHFQVRVELLDIQPENQVSKVKTEDIPVKSIDPWGEAYSVDIGNLEIGQTYEVVVNSVDRDQKLYTSKSCQGVLIIGAGDGSWSSWSPWSSCSSGCVSVPGTRMRTRRCDSPVPSNNGRYCTGSNNMRLSCFGDNVHC